MLPCETRMHCCKCRGCLAMPALPLDFCHILLIRPLRTCAGGRRLGVPCQRFLEVFGFGEITFASNLPWATCLSRVKTCVRAYGWTCTNAVTCISAVALKQMRAAQALPLKLQGSLIALLWGASRKRACVATRSCGVALLTAGPASSVRGGFPCPGAQAALFLCREPSGSAPALPLMPATARTTSASGQAARRTSPATSPTATSSCLTTMSGCRPQSMRGESSVLA